MQPDLHLLNRYHHHGDAGAFQALVQAHAGMVHATAHRVTRDVMLAQDVAQETFLALARSSGAAIQSVGAWLHHVAWQKAQNVVRGECRRQSHEATAALLSDSAGESSWAEIEPWLDEALAELPEPTRTMIVERFLAGRTQQDLAARMGVSQSTVSRQLNAAIGDLRSRLRAKGVVCGAGLAALLTTLSATAAPASLTASLGKVSISGLGTNATITPAATITSTLIAMTTTTKLLLAAAAVSVISVPFVFHHSPPAQPPKQLAQVKAVPSSLPVKAMKSADDDGKRHYRPAPVSREVSQKVDDIIRRYKGTTKAERMKSPELNELMNRFVAAMSKVMERPEMEARMTERLAALPRELGNGSMLRMDLDNLDDAHSRAFLEAAVSNDSNLMQEWCLNTLDAAVFEFAFDPDLERTSNGVSIHSTERAKSKAPADPNEND